MAGMQGYVCPSCGGTLEFDSRTQKLLCRSCGSTFDAAGYDVQHNVGQQAGMQSGQSQQWDTNADGIIVYKCQNCGGEIMGDQNTGASKCPYCENPMIMLNQFSGSLKPELIIPFKLDKEEAIKRYMSYVSGKKLVPSVFKGRRRADDIKGVYVPFWLYDAKVSANATFEAIKETKQGDTVKQDHYDVSRSGNMTFQGVPINASSKIPGDLMDSIGPFDIKDTVPFTPAYLAGYMADKYDIEKEKTYPDAEKRIKNSAAEELRNTVQGYSTVDVVSNTSRIMESAVHYALYPVWMLNSKWKGEDFQFAMNGQTGKLLGNLPCDKGLYKKQLILGGAIAALAIFAVLFLIWFVR